MSRSPIREYMPVEIDRWFGSASIQSMKDFQRWWFMSLLLRGWQLDPPCHLPNDQNKLWMLAGAASPDAWKKHSAIVLAEFDTVGDGQWLLNKRQWEIYQEKLSVNTSNVSRGKKGAEKRWQKHSPAIAELSTDYSNASLSSSDSAVGLAFELETFDFEESFLALWRLYPRREDSDLIRQWYIEAVEKCANRHGFRRSEAANYILSRTEIYASKCKFIRNFRDYLHEHVYEQDDSMWESGEIKNGPDMAIGARRDGPWTQEEYDQMRGKQ